MMAGEHEPQSRQSQAWRVQPTEPASLTVMVDAYTEIYIPPPDATHDRTDLIAEYISAAGRVFSVIVGSSFGAPVTPEGWTPIAMVHTPAGAAAIDHSMIGALP